MSAPPWAAEALELPTDTDRETARAAFLKRLEADTWQPAERTVAALAEFGGAALPITAEADRELPAVDGAEIKAFLRNFWLMVPNRRRSQWQRMARQAKCDNRSRLYSLYTALDIPCRTESPDPRVRDLGEILRELATLSPAARTLRRHEWLQELANRELWREAMEELRAVEPRVAAFDPPLAEWIETSPWRRLYAEPEPETSRKEDNRTVQPQSFKRRSAPAKRPLENKSTRSTFQELKEKYRVLFIILGIILFIALMSAFRGPVKYR